MITFHKRLKDSTVNSNTFHFFTRMVADVEKEHYKNLLAKDKAKARA